MNPRHALTIAVLATLAGAAHAQPLFPAQFDLATLDGANGFIIGRPTMGVSPFGVSVSGGHDVNQDGVADLIIGDHQPGSTPGIRYGTFVVFGGAGVGADGVIDVDALNGADGYRISTMFDSGFSVASVGDVNQDGAGDILIGAPHYSPHIGVVETGAAYLVFGGAGVGAGGSLSLGSVDDGTNGILYRATIDTQAGFSVSAAGDVNADSIPDFLVGAPFAQVDMVADAGETYVVFGAPGLTPDTHLGHDLFSLDGSDGFIIRGEPFDGESGYTVSDAGDVNGDGVDDIIIGSERVNPAGALSAGESYVVFGGPTVGQGPISLNNLDGSDGFCISGRDPDDFSGTTVSAAGDLNNDGYADIAVTAPGGLDIMPFADFGECYIIFGGPSVGSSGSVLLNSLNGNNGFIVTGISASDQIGDSVAPAGDINQDGIDDLIIGAQNAGEAYVIFGRSVVSEWTPLQGGAFDNASNWSSGAVPLSGTVIIEPNFGGTITGPGGALFIRELSLAAGAGRTTLETQPGSIISIDSDLTIPSSAELAGAGIVRSTTLSVEGVVRMDGMTYITDSPSFAITPGGRAEISSAFIDAPVSNSGEIALGEYLGGAASQLETTDAVVNHAEGDILVFGDAELRFPALDNDGSTSLLASTAIVYGAITNNGVFSASDGSVLTLVDDLANSGSFVLAPDSRLTLLGSLTGNGVTGPGGGVGGDVFIEGDIIPGMALQVGVAQFGGDVGIGAAGTLRLELVGATESDRLVSLGDVSLSGALVVEGVHAYTPQAGDTYTIVSGDSVTGTFASTSFPEAPDGLRWSLTYHSDRVVLAIASADLDGDGSVDSADLAALLASWGGPGADLDGDGVTNASDLAILLAAWG